MNMNLKNYNRIIIIILGIFLSGCASKNNLVNVADNNNDPYESTNRAIFAFNEDLDELIFKPVARGWRKIPDFPRKNLSNLAETATAPLDIANSILQFDIESIRITLSRFLINMTFGVGGMYDVASTKEFGGITPDGKIIDYGAKPFSLKTDLSLSKAMIEFFSFFKICSE